MSAVPLVTERQADRNVNALIKGIGKIYFGAATEYAKIKTGQTAAILQQSFGQVTNETAFNHKETMPAP